MFFDQFEILVEFDVGWLPKKFGYVSRVCIWLC